MRILGLLLSLLLVALGGGAAVARPKPALKAPPLRIVAPLAGVEIAAGDGLEIQVVLRGDISNQVDSVQLLCDGKGIDLIHAPPYSCTWDTTGLKSGNYVLEAYAFTRAGSKLAASPVQVKVTSRQVNLQESTPVLLVTQDKLVSGETPQGSPVRFKVDRDVLAPDGRVLIAAGAEASGEVVKSEGSGFFGKSGVLDLAVRNVVAVDGTQVPLRATRSDEGQDNTGGVIAGAVLLSVFFVFMSGSEVEIPPGTLLSAYVARDTAVVRPGPVRKDLDRKLSLLMPAAGARLQPTSEYDFAVQLQPADERAYYRVYLDDRLLVSQRGSPEKLSWKGSDDWKPGKHVLKVEATASSGRVFLAPPVEFEVVED
jgi:hypothetical protein